MRRGLLIAVLLFLVITAGWWFLFMAGKSSEISDFEDQTATARIEESTLEARRNELQALAAREGEYLLALGEIQKSIPQLPEGAAFIEDINRIAEETGVELLALSPNPPIASAIDGLFEISTTIRFQAPYFKVLSVLFALEDLERLVRVDAITIDAALEDDGTNLLSTTLTATAFSYSDLGAVAPTAAATDDGAGAADDGANE